MELLLNDPRTITQEGGGIVNVGKGIIHKKNKINVNEETQDSKLRMENSIILTLSIVGHNSLTPDTYRDQRTTVVSRRASSDCMPIRDANPIGLFTIHFQ